MTKPEVSASRVALEEQWGLLRAAHPNVLVVGTDSVVHDALCTLRCGCRQPLVTDVTTDPLVLPSRSACGTLLLRNVLTLSLEDQQRLLTWLDDGRGGAQVITTAAQSPWPQDGMLSVRGERHEEKEEQGKTFHRIERAHGRFERRLAVPAQVETQKVAAEFKDGVLKVHLPKTAAAKPKAIDVKVA